jgi:hypothetical protein
MRRAVLIAALGGCSFHPPSAEIDAPAGGVADAPRVADASVDAVAASCPSGWQTLPSSASRYLVQSDLVATWHGAEMTCEQMGAGIHLAALETGGEMTNLANRFDLTKQYWVGIVQPLGQMFPGDDWKVITGGDAPNQWSIGEPNDGGGTVVDQNREQFAVVNAFGVMLDEPGGNNHQFACECDGKALDPGVMIPP